MGNWDFLMNGTTAICIKLDLSRDYAKGKVPV